MPDRAAKLVDRGNACGEEQVTRGGEFFIGLGNAGDASLGEFGRVVQQPPTVGRPEIHRDDLAVGGGPGQRPGFGARNPGLIVQFEEILGGQELVHADAGRDQEDVRALAGGELRLQHVGVLVVGGRLELDLDARLFGELFGERLVDVLGPVGGRGDRERDILLGCFGSGRSGGCNRGCTTGQYGSDQQSSKGEGDDPFSW